ncbi:uncharacterized protein TNCV_2795891 [Trichonephila clavipes]|nr:uncharacterized protein TNCV_2795891 [Trichonephila clavipes]
MLNDDEIVTSVQAESDSVYDETDEDEDNNNESSKGPSDDGAFSALETVMEWYEQQSAVILNYCCSRETETLQRKNEGVQWYSEKSVIIFPNKEHGTTPMSVKGDIEDVSTSTGQWGCTSFMKHSDFYCSRRVRI